MMQHEQMNEARSALADAISRRGYAERELQQARDAGATAFQRKVDARKALERFRENQAAGQQDSDAQSLIEAIHGGDIAVMERAATRPQQDEGELVRQRDLWAQAHGVCESAIKDRERDLETALLRVAAAAAHVVGGSPELEAFLAKQEDIRRTYEAGCEALRFMSSGGLLTNDQRVRAARIVPLDQPGTISRKADRSRAAEWDDAVQKLLLDAAAPLPGATK